MRLKKNTSAPVRLKYVSVCLKVLFSKINLSHNVILIYNIY
jgi:hypothetical protein